MIREHITFCDIIYCCTACVNALSCELAGVMILAQMQGQMQGHVRGNVFHLYPLRIMFMCLLLREPEEFY